MKNNERGTNGYPVGQNRTPNAGHFYAIGLSYQKADAETRGHFSVTPQAQDAILQQAKAEGVGSICVISTCNRTEIYGIAAHPYLLIKLLCEHTQGTLEEFEQVSYIKKGNDAIRHMFRVGTGLDSQILGDFEIISQLRNGLRRSKDAGILNAYMERLGNSVIQASKRIKNETEISTGATSVSFAAVQYIMQQVPDISEKNILLFGIGKIGRNTCENLIKHTGNTHITLINRTKLKAQQIAGKFNVVVKDYANIQSEIAGTDILIVATGAQQPTISKELLYLNKELLILDLSIPMNVAPNVADNPFVRLVHLDELTHATNQTLAHRQGQLPQAIAIIEAVEEEFLSWSRNRKFAPTIQALKAKLTSIKAGEIDNQRRKRADFDQEQAELIGDRLIQKITTHFANHLKDDSFETESSIELIERIFNLNSSQS